MHKVFYASGFLYHPPTQQILLQQPKNHALPSQPSLWSLISGKNNKSEHPHETFKRIVQELLNLKLSLKSVIPIYDYEHRLYKKPHFVVYAEVKRARTFPSSKDYNFLWVTFKQTLKIPFNEYTKQDIVVGERVIKAKVRDSEVNTLQST